LAQVLHVAISTPSGIYWCARTIWRHLKESLRPQFSFEKADMVEGLPGVQVQSLSENGSYRRDFSIYREIDVLFQIKIREASEKFKNQPQVMPRSVHFRQHFWNLSHETVPLSIHEFRRLSFVSLITGKGPKGKIGKFILNSLQRTLF
jgi:hypothetical protein